MVLPATAELGATQNNSSFSIGFIKVHFKLGGDQRKSPVSLAKFRREIREICEQFFSKYFISGLEGTARYAGFLLATVEGFGLWLRICWPFGPKQKLFMMF